MYLKIPQIAFMDADQWAPLPIFGGPQLNTFSIRFPLYSSFLSNALHPSNSNASQTLLNILFFNALFRFLTYFCCFTRVNLQLFWDGIVKRKSTIFRKMLILLTITSSISDFFSCKNFYSIIASYFMQHVIYVRLPFCIAFVDCLSCLLCPIIPQMSRKQHFVNIQHVLQLRSQNKRWTEVTKIHWLTFKI